MGASTRRGYAPGGPFLGRPPFLPSPPTSASAILRSRIRAQPDADRPSSRAACSNSALSSLLIRISKRSSFSMGAEYTTGTDGLRKLPSHNPLTVPYKCRIVLIVGRRGGEGRQVKRPDESRRRSLTT